MRLTLAQANPFQHCPRWVRDRCSSGHLPVPGKIDPSTGSRACSDRMPSGTPQPPGGTTRPAMFRKPPEDRRGRPQRSQERHSSHPRNHEPRDSRLRVTRLAPHVGRPNRGPHPRPGRQSGQRPEAARA
jgi:hypothetical protein